jgi:hypothetical protein
VLAGRVFLGIHLFAFLAVARLMRPVTASFEGGTTMLAGFLIPLRGPGFSAGLAIPGRMRPFLAHVDLSTALRARDGVPRGHHTPLSNRKAYHKGIPDSNGIEVAVVGQFEIWSC